MFRRCNALIDNVLHRVFVEVFVEVSRKENGLFAVICGYFSKKAGKRRASLNYLPYICPRLQEDGYGKYTN